MNKFRIVVIAILLITARGALCMGEEPATLNITEFKDAASLKKHEADISKITLRGKVTRASFDYHAVAPGVRVWISEYPSSKALNIKSDKHGWWTLSVIKHRGTDLGFSFVYEKAGWVATKSNVITITDSDDLDMSMQYIDPGLYQGLVKPGVEKMLAEKLPAGSDTTFRNGVVVTVGQPWASMHCDMLPHGFPGATATVIPGAVGPLYFDETVRPNLTYTATSVDGGVAWVNVPRGAHTISAAKQGEAFNDVRFSITEADAESNIVLYIASPPDTIKLINNPKNETCPIPTPPR